MLQYLKKVAPAQIAATLSVPAFAQMGPGYPGYWHDDWGWGHMIFGGAMMVIFWGVIILVIILVVRMLSGGGQHRHAAPPDRKEAVEILKERFARGEIDKEEFEERKRLLMN